MEWQSHHAPRPALFNLFRHDSNQERQKRHKGTAIALSLSFGLLLTFPFLIIPLYFPHSLLYPYSLLLSSCSSSTFSNCYSWFPYLYIPHILSFSTSSTPFPSLSPFYLSLTLFYFRLSFTSSFIFRFIRIIISKSAFPLLPHPIIFWFLPPSYSPVSPSICPESHSCAHWAWIC